MAWTPEEPSSGTPMIGLDGRPSAPRTAPAYWPWFDSMRPMPASVAHEILHFGWSARIASSALPYADSARAGTPVTAATWLAHCDSVAGPVLRACWGEV